VVRVTVEVVVAVARPGATPGRCVGPGGVAGAGSGGRRGVVAGACVVGGVVLGGVVGLLPVALVRTPRSRGVVAVLSSSCPRDGHLDREAGSRSTGCR